MRRSSALNEIKIPVDQKDMMTAHIENFLECMRTREKPHLDVETGARAQAVINLAVQSYREGRVMYWDEKNWKAVRIRLRRSRATGSRICTGTYGQRGSRLASRFRN